MESGNKEEPKILIFLEINNKSYKKIEKLINKYDNKAFIVVSDTKKVCNGIIK